MEQLTRAHDRDREVLIAQSFDQSRDQLGWGLLPPLCLDEYRRIDQEPQGRSSMGSPASTAMRSRPNPSSRVTGVRPRRIARHSDAFRAAIGGEVIRQTSRPLRLTTYVAPRSILS